MNRAAGAKGGMVKAPDKIDTLVLLLGAPGPTGRANAAIRGITRLQKLLFLIQEVPDFDGGSRYKFAPYRFGPFSKDIYDAVQFLVEGGFLKVGGATKFDHYASIDDAQFNDETAPELVSGRDRSYVLTEKGRRLADALAARTPQHDLRIIERIKREFGGLPLSGLIRFVYDQYPDSAVNSELAHLKP